jgi:hypothetical protein
MSETDAQRRTRHALAAQAKAQQQAADGPTLRQLRDANQERIRQERDNESEAA